MAWASHPDPASSDQPLDVVTRSLDPVLVPLGFAPGQAATDASRGGVTYCRGDGADGGCVDLVLDLQALPEWRVVDVRYWGFPSDQWHLEFDREVPLRDQLSGLRRSLPRQLSTPGTGEPDAGPGVPPPVPPA